MDLFCPDASQNLFGFFDITLAPRLLFYSYIPIIIVALLFGFYIFTKNKKSLDGKLILLISTAFSVQILNEIIQWIAVHVKVVHFSWQLSAILQVSIYAFIILFVFYFLNKQKVLAFRYKVLLFLGVLPVVALLFSEYNISSFDLVNCQGNNGILWFYIYGYEIFSIILVSWMCLKKYFSKTIDKSAKEETLLFMSGVVLFLIIFTITNILGDATLVYQINLVGPLGMVVFLGFLSYTIVKFKAFNIKLLGSEILIAVLFFLVFAMFFVRRIENVKYVLVFTLIFIIILGRSLIRGVKREVASREKIEELADSLVKSNDKLENANNQLKELDRLKSEFLSLASHQIRNPLTAIKGYASLVLDGTYGEVSQSVREAVDRMYQSTQSLVTIVSDFLDVSRIEQGTMKYDFTSFDIKKLAIQVVAEFKPSILKAGLEISVKASNEDYFVNADQGKIKQVIGNFIDNSIKYTPKGSIQVSLARHTLSDGISGRVRVIVSDTGIGMDKEVIPHLFARFTRDKDAFRTNVSGTGLGLYITKQMIEAHHGKIWAESDGKGKGSRFIFEIDTIR